jgi:hypothetical protein
LRVNIWDNEVGHVRPVPALHIFRLCTLFTNRERLKAYSALSESDGTGKLRFVKQRLARDCYAYKFCMCELRLEILEDFSTTKVINLVR